MLGEGRPRAAGKRSSWHDSGRWPTSPVTAPCPPVGTSAASMAGTSDGADWSNGQDWRRTGPADLAGGLTRLQMGHSSCRLRVRQVMRKMPGRVGTDQPILRTPAATGRLRLASRARPQARRWVCLPVCRHGPGAHAGEFALASRALFLFLARMRVRARRSASAPWGERPRSRCDRRALWLWRGGGLRRESCARTAASARSAATHWCHSRSAMNGCRRRLR
jgi:hypothetical protein